VSHRPPALKPIAATAVVAAVVVAVNGGACSSKAT
jgi:hypothetical protein